MSNNLSGRNFLKEVDFTALEWLELLTLSESLKADKAAGREQQHLTGKNIALIFEKTSTRTRCAFEVAAFDQEPMSPISTPAAARLGTRSR